MSYDLWVWDVSRRPVPKTFEEATGLFLSLHTVEDVVNPRFVAFAKALVAQDSVDSSAGDDATWAGDPVQEALDNKRAMFGQAIPIGNRLRVMFDFVEVAKDHGLGVFDEQTGMAFLPTGQVLPVDREDVWQEIRSHVKERPPAQTKAQLKKLLVSRLKPLLEKHGFSATSSKDTDAVFIKTLAQGQQRVEIYLEGKATDLQCIVHFQSNFPRVRTIYEHICGDWSGGGSGKFTVFFTLRELLVQPSYWRHALVDATDANSILMEVARALGILENCQSFADAHATVQRESIFQDARDSRFVYLILGRLAGAPEFERYVERLRIHHAERQLEAREKLEALISYLRDHVEPVKGA